MEYANEEQYGKYKLKCKCRCGNLIIVNKSNILLGKTKSCGCLQKQSRYNKINDLTGKRFGKLTVIKRVENKGKQIRYLCRCDCGNEKIFYASNLRRGLSTSCGCFRKEKISQLKFEDLTGNRYGNLIVTSLHHYNEKTRQYYWNCKCDCGNECVVYGGHLKDGHTISCGCINSLGEKLIAKILTDNEILFKKQYKFNDLRSDKNYPLSFDFAIFKEEELKCLIEYQGTQHYNYDATWKCSKESFEDGQRRDNLKRKYCKDNNILLIEIPYWDFKKIDFNYLKEKMNYESWD